MSGAKAFASRFKVYLRKKWLRPILRQINAAENRKTHLGKWKYPLVVLEMKMGKINRRLLNFSFNRLFGAQKVQKWSREQSAFPHLQTLTALYLRPLFSLLSHDSDNSYIQLVVSLVPLVTMMSRKTTFSMRYAWVKLIEKSLEVITTEADIPTLPVSESIPLLPLGRTPSPSKASLRIPSISDMTVSAMQSPVTKVAPFHVHRPSKSSKINVSQPVKLNEKPPWKRPNALLTGSNSKPFSPRDRRNQYAQDLRSRHNRPYPAFQLPLSPRTPSNSHSVDPYRADSPTLLSPTSQRFPPTYKSTRPSSSTMRSQESRGKSREADSGSHTLTAAYALDKLRQSQGREIVKMWANVLFTVQFRVFSALKVFPGHMDDSQESALEVDWHQRLYLIGAERVRRLLKELIGKQLRAGLQGLAE